MPRCAPTMEKSDLDLLTVVSSHEFIEAATDPFPEERPAFDTVDADHLAWMAVTGGTEVGDMCVESEVTTPRLPFLVQASWSNAAARAGRNPCIPSADGVPYVNAAPVLDEEVGIAVQGPGATTRTKGVAVPVGVEKTIDVVLFSDAKTGGPFDVKVVDLAVACGGEPELELHLDRSKGVNGERSTVSGLPKAHHRAEGGAGVLGLHRADPSRMRTHRGTSRHARRRSCPIADGSRPEGSRIVVTVVGRTASLPGHEPSSRASRRRAHARGGGRLRLQHDDPLLPGGLPRVRMR